MTWIPWVVASLVSNVAIIFIEYQNRSATGGWLEVLPFTFIPIFVAQWCLFYSFNSAPHWLVAWLVFSIGNSVMRVGAVQVMADHEIQSWPLVLMGVSVMLGGALVLKMGLR